MDCMSRMATKGPREERSNDSYSALCMRGSSHERELAVQAVTVTVEVAMSSSPATIVSVIVAVSKTGSP